MNDDRGNAESLHVWHVKVAVRFGLDSVQGWLVGCRHTLHPRLKMDVKSQRCFEKYWTG